ncbi:uridine kinase [Kribbella capetownensis]|uniref:Uridine kinase n=1 Tax=Kribbella capetownensis TaxID=1572659 RepID=A0A4R0K5T0_9ACTN|nr:uridine kinase [Kribbella capetownensis]
MLTWLADSIPHSTGDDCVRVGIDGVDGSGKTTFANELAEALRAAGRNVVRVSVDDFHNVRAIRYRRGRSSPEGFWRDSFNYDRLRTDVLEPLGTGGSRRYRPAAHDLATDQILEPPCEVAPAGAVLVVDGLFLHRDELANAWDLSVFLDVPFDITIQRMAHRDGTNPDPNHPTVRRYVEAQHLYFKACNPHQKADILIANTPLNAPRPLRIR